MLSFGSVGTPSTFDSNDLQSCTELSIASIFKMPVPVGTGMSGPSTFDKCKFMSFPGNGLEVRCTDLETVKMGAMMGTSKLQERRDVYTPVLTNVLQLLEL